MNIQSTSLLSLRIIEPDVFRDSRGCFLETYNERSYRGGGIHAGFVQDNQSISTRGTLRGLHAQRRHPQGKLVRALSGAIFDVAVDIRRGSPTFLQWYGTELTGRNFRQIYIPPGFAHGFCVMSDEAVVEYKCTDFYYPDDQITIAWNDPSIDVEWPITAPTLSEKDHLARPVAEQMQRLPFFTNSDKASVLSELSHDNREAA